MSDDNASGLAQHLKEHPRMMGALFTMLLLLSQAGSAAAGGYTAGP
ncbi:MAG: hypothetical protein V5A31_10580 [Haloferacaceae archaeon]|jgi:hypothetical protein